MNTGHALRRWGPLGLLGLLVLGVLPFAFLPVGNALWAKVLAIRGEVALASATPVLSQGCTPGFWKQAHHFAHWPAAYRPEDSFARIFLGLESPEEPTLLQALDPGGGGFVALMRQAVAALLNAAHGSLIYPYTPEQVIAMFREAMESGEVETTKALFEQANEGTCPLPDPPTETPSATDTPTATPTDTPTPTASPSPSPTATPTPTATPSQTATATATASETPTDAPEPSPTDTTTPSPTAAEPTETVTPMPSEVPSPTPTPCATDTPQP